METKTIYIPPLVEVMEFKPEQGFATSPSGNSEGWGDVPGQGVW